MDSLPQDVLLQIFAAAGPPFSPYAAVCRRFHRILSTQHQFVWFLCIECAFALDFASALALARKADSVQRSRWSDAWNRRHSGPLCGNRRGLRDLLFLPSPAAVRVRRANDGSSVALPDAALSEDDVLLARTGRWFALYRLLPRWRSLEPLILELRRVLAFFGARTRQLQLDENLQHAIEDAARLELAVRDYAPPPGAADDVETVRSQLGGVGRVPAACGEACVLLARICFAELPATVELPRTGILFVVAARRDASGAVHGVRAFYVRDESTLHPAVAKLSSAKHASAMRLLAFTAALSLPPPPHAATPSVLRKSAAYEFLCSVWHQSRTARGRHSMLGFVQSFDAGRFAARQRECDEATLCHGRHTCGASVGCGRDVYGVCGQRPLLSLQSTPGSVTFGALSACVVWIAGGARMTTEGAQLKAFDSKDILELAVTFE